MQNFSNKIKLMCITPNLRVGGAQRFILNLVNNINKDIFDVTLVVVNNKKSMKLFLDSEINIINLKKTKIRYSIIQIIKISKKIKPNIIFTNQFHLNLYIILFKKLFSRNIKFIGRETNIMSEKLNRKNVSDNFFFFLIKLIYPFFNKIICQSQDMYDDLKDIFKISKSNLIKINNPINPKIFKNTIIKKDNQKYNIIAIGSSLGRQKGFYTLIESFKFINDKSITLAIIGDGLERKKLEQKIKKNNLEDRVFMVGMQENLRSFYENADVLACSSYYEGFPNMFLEAGIYGLPVVSFNIKGGVNEIIDPGENGFIVSQRNIKEFAETLVKAINYPFNKKKIKELTLNKFNMVKIIHKYERLFFDIINK